jgi:transcriptional regulator with XRE-family HTH domain
MAAGSGLGENVNMAPIQKTLNELGPHYFRQWREHRGLSQEQAAAELDVSRELISKIENRKSPYTQRMLEAAAAIYQCTPADLLVRDPHDRDSLWPLFERADRATGRTREQIRRLILVALET